MTREAPWIALCCALLGLASWALDRAARAGDRVEVAAEVAVRAAADARRARADAELAREAATSCYQAAAADVDVAHARALRLEVALRAVAATSACRERLPEPFPVPDRPLWCEGPGTWSAPLPTPGRSCYPPEARVGP